MTPADRTRDYIAKHREDGAKAIAQALAADPRFARRITGEDLNGLFGEQQVLAFKLKRAAANTSMPEQMLPIQAGIDRLLETARLGEKGWVATDETRVAAQIRQFAPAVVQEGIVSKAESDALLALAGGPYYAPLSEAEVQAELDRLDVADALEQHRQAAEAIERQWAAVYNAGIDLIHAARDQGTAVPTLAELRAVEAGG